MIDEYIKQIIEKEVEKKLTEKLAPLRQLPEKFASKITLSIEDMCEILSVENSKSGRESIRNACKRGELPFRSFGRDVIFPRPMVEDYLLGIWQPGEKNQGTVQSLGAKLAMKIRK